MTDAPSPRGVAFGMRYFRRLNIYLILLLIVFAGCQRGEPRDEPEVRRVVTEFGQELKQVPLSADRETAVAAMKDHYGKFVSPLLLEEWTANPAIAPGRLTSSPWP